MSSKQNTRKLTKAEAETVTAEVNRLTEQAQAQLEEHKDWLRVQLLRTNPPLTVLDSVTDIKLEVVKIEPNKTVSVVWGYPDALHAYIATHSELAEALAGGTEVKQEPTAVQEP